MDSNRILGCLCGGLDATPPTSLSQTLYRPIDEKPALTPPPAYRDNPTRTPEQKAADERAAAKIVAILRTTDTTDEAALRAELDDAMAPVRTAGWSEWLAESVFHALRSTLGEGDDTNWAVALTDAYKTARAAAEEEFSDFWRYAKEHPGELAAEVVLEILLSLVAFGILVRMARWVVTLLGFAEKGILAGMLSSRLVCVVSCSDVISAK